MYLNKVLILLVLLILILFNIFINILNFNNNSIFNNDTLKLNNIKWVPVTPQVTLPVTQQSPALKITQAPALITTQVVTTPDTTDQVTAPATTHTAPILIFDRDLDLDINLDNFWSNFSEVYYNADDFIKPQIRLIYDNADEAAIQYKIYTNLKYVVDIIFIIVN